ncbi:MAG: hypothetical protein Q9168_004803 [Polycauliona sp. 1 TL-2023]
MKSNYVLALSWLAIMYPSAISAQRGRGGGRSRPNQAQPAPVAVEQTTTTTFVPAPTIAPVVQKNVVGDTTTNNNDDGEGDVTTTAPPATNTGGASTGGDSPSGGSTGGGNSADCGGAVDGHMNVRVSGDSVSYRFEPSVAGNPSEGTIGDCDVWSFPPGWNGRVHIGGGSGAPDGGTLYEGNVGGSTGAMDVSYVEGFSVPMMCTDNTNKFVSGCGIDLFTKGTCPTGGSAGGVCKNPQGPGGDRDSANNACEACSPPDPFFAPCAAAAYTFPDDDDAVDGQSGLDITCVVGASSKLTGREGKTAKTGNPQAGRCEVCAGGNSKRTLENVLFGRGVQPSARSPSMLPRAHRRTTVGILGKRSHRHGIAHGSVAR